MPDDINAIDLMRDWSSTAKEGQSVKVGCIYYNENPKIIHSAIVSLFSYGVQPKDIAIVEKLEEIIAILAEGDTLVVNSLHDLYFIDLNLMDTLVSILDKGVSIAFLDNGQWQVINGSTEAIEFLRLLKSNIEFDEAYCKSMKSNTLSETNPMSRSRNSNGRVSQFHLKLYKKNSSDISFWHIDAASSKDRRL